MTRIEIKFKIPYGAISEAHFQTDTRLSLKIKKKIVKFFRPSANLRLVKDSTWNLIQAHGEVLTSEENENLDVDPFQKEMHFHDTFLKEMHF